MVSPLYERLTLAAADRPEILEIMLAAPEELRRPIMLLAPGQVGRAGWLSLVELGCSAGLNLFPDRYRYRYGAAPEIGEPDSPVLLSVECRGERKPPVPSAMPRIERRIGIDLSPIDLNADAEFD